MAPDPTSKERKEFANIIMEFLEERYQCDEIVVELHLTKLNYDKLIQLLNERGYEYCLYADAPLEVILMNYDYKETKQASLF